MTEGGPARSTEVDQADSIVLGCAGMASHRSSLESRIGIPVIDPVQAAVSMAIRETTLTNE